MSTTSAPASIAFIRLTSVTPVVAWQCTWIRTSWPEVVLDRLDDVVGRLRLEQGRHVLEAQRVAAQVHQVAGHLDVALDGVQRALGVADGALRVLVHAADGRDRLAHVADVVERVEDPEDVHAVLGGLLHEPVDDPVLVVPVAEQVLAAQQHLQPAVGHQLAERAQPLPRVLVEEADAGVVRRPAPALHRPVARRRRCPRTRRPCPPGPSGWPSGSGGRRAGPAR